MSARVSEGKAAVPTGHEADGPPTRTKASALRSRGGQVNILFLVPALLFLGLIVVVPAAIGATYSFTDWRGFGGFEWVGLDNYVRLLGDAQALAALRNTVVLAVVVVVGQNLIGLVLALLLEAPMRGRRVLQVLFLMPVIISPVIVSYLWQYIFAPEGALNWVLDNSGLGFLHRAWLGDPSTALGAIAVVVIWQYSGNAMVIYLAGLLGIPEELSEASQLDGANVWQRIIRIKLPLLAPAITINLVLSSITALRLFDQVIAMTSGGPGYATETLASVIYKRGFSAGEFGYGLAMAIILALGIALLSLVQTITLSRRERFAE